MATAAFDVSLIVLFAQVSRSLIICVQCAMPDISIAAPQFYYAEYVQKSKRREQDGGRADKKAV